MPTVKILNGFVVETPRGVFLGGTTADLSDQEIADNPGKTEALIVAPVVEAAPVFARGRVDPAPAVPAEN